MKKAWGTKQTGFTIVELLIVIVVIAILAAITIVSYNGVTKSAMESRRLSAIDDNEKLTRLAMAENGTGVFGAGTVTLNQSTGVLNYPNTFPQSAYTTVGAPGYPGYGESTWETCLPGNYPAGGLFRKDECMVIYQTFTKQGQTNEIPFSRLGYTIAGWYLAVVSPKYAAQAPQVPADNLISTVSSLPNVDYSSFGLGTGTLKTYVASRGVRVDYATVIDNWAGQKYDFTTRVVGFSYTVVGNAQCGRGTKTYTDLSALLAQVAAMSDADVAAMFGITLAEVPAMRQYYQDTINSLVANGTPLQQTTCNIAIDDGTPGGSAPI